MHRDEAVVEKGESLALSYVRKMSDLLDMAQEACDSTGTIERHLVGTVPKEADVETGPERDDLDGFFPILETRMRLVRRRLTTVLNKLRSINEVLEMPNDSPGESKAIRGRDN